MGILEHSFCIVNQLSFILKVKFEAFMCISCFYTHHLCQEKFSQMWPPFPDSAAKSPNRWRNEILSEGQKSWKFQEKRKISLSFILTEKTEYWQISLAINSIVGRLNRYLSNNSLSVMVSKGLLLSLYTLGLGIIAFLSLLRLLSIILDTILDFE